MELLELVRNNLGKPYEDHEFLLNCLKEVMIESGEDGLAFEIPWINSGKDFQNNSFTNITFSFTLPVFSCLTLLKSTGLFRTAD